MRTLPTFNAPTPAAPTTTTSTSATTPATSAVAQQRSPWHSPVPYLFGGLAAMLGLIAFALLILACSYWRLSGRVENGDQNRGERDVESGEKDEEGDGGKAVKIYEEKILVIMAGDVKPTFLATPVCSKASSFADGKDTSKNEDGEKMEVGEKVKEIADHEENKENQEQNQ